MEFVTFLALLVIIGVGGAVFLAAVGAFLIPIVVFFGGSGHRPTLAERVSHKPHDYYEDYGG